MASVGFRWLDILEKEFDKAFVDLDLAIGELDSEEPDVVFNVRQKLCTLSSCFAQLTHKAQTIFQNSAKIEAELIHLRAELVDSKAKREMLEQELHNLLLQVHSSQLSQLPDNLGGNRKQDPSFKPDVNNIKKKLEAELQQSPVRNIRLNNELDELKFSSTLLESAQRRAENAQLQLENATLRNSILSLNSEVYGAKLAAKYLDKELAGRIQQLQLLVGREMRGDIRDKLWRQLESEILLQRHKTVVRACRRNSVVNNNSSEKSSCPKPEIVMDSLNERTEHFGDIRTVVVKRKPSQGLGISITGGREHGVPILISELEANGPAALSEQLYIGDAILSVNARDLRQACHREAVDILQQQSGDCTLEVQYIAADDSDTSLEEDGYNFRFFDSEVCGGAGGGPGSESTNIYNNIGGLGGSTAMSNHHSNGDHRTVSNSMDNDIVNTPTAPRTPESCSANSRIVSRNSGTNSPDEMPKIQKLIVLEETEDYNNSAEQNNLIYNYNNLNGNLETYKNNMLTATKEDLNNCNIPASITTGDEVVNRTAHLKTGSTDLKLVDTSNLVLYDNATNNLIKLENFKKVDNIIDDENFNYCSTNSLNSENFSSPMQTSTDVFLDSELLSTDIASNDSQSPKNLQPEVGSNNSSFTYGASDVTKKNTCDKFTGEGAPQRQILYTSNESLSNPPKSDQSLLNSAESCGSSPVRKINRDYKKVQRKHKKKYFGVKTLQSIFNKQQHDGYSDISTTASEMGDEPHVTEQQSQQQIKSYRAAAKTSVVPKSDNQHTTDNNNSTLLAGNPAMPKPAGGYLETSPQFEENIHSILSDIFIKSFAAQTTQHPQLQHQDSSSSSSGLVSNNSSALALAKPTTKKYFSLHGQNLRVGKALRLCPNEDYCGAADSHQQQLTSGESNEQRKEKLLARYVYNANSISADGVGDPDFGTPV